MRKSRITCTKLSETRLRRWRRCPSLAKAVVASLNGRGIGDSAELALPR
jgi:hypothetical protein